MDSLSAKRFAVKLLVVDIKRAKSWPWFPRFEA